MNCSCSYQSHRISLHNRVNNTIRSANDSLNKQYAACSWSAVERCGSAGNGGFFFFEEVVDYIPRFIRGSAQCDAVSGCGLLEDSRHHGHKTVRRDENEFTAHRMRISDDAQAPTDDIAG